MSKFPSFFLGACKQATADSLPSESPFFKFSSAPLILFHPNLGCQVFQCDKYKVFLLLIKHKVP